MAVEKLGRWARGFGISLVDDRSTALLRIGQKPLGKREPKLWHNGRWGRIGLSTGVRVVGRVDAYGTVNL